MPKSKKLFKVKLKGLKGGTVGIDYQTSFVVAEGLDEAYKKVRDYLDKEDLGFAHERELNRIEVLADEKGETWNLLFI